MLTVVTQCNLNYTSRAIALIESLLNQSSPVKIKIVTHDNESNSIIQKHFGEQSEVISILDLVDAYPELKVTKKNRSETEYFFAITPFLIKYLQEVKSIKEVWYVDADIRFFGDISELIKDTKQSDITLTSHRFPPKLSHLKKYGKYNVGVIYTSGSAKSKQLINWWSKKCLESTSLDISTGVYGDQKYLDEFELHGAKLATFSGIGSNAAPWNCNSIKIYNNAIVCPDSSELIAFHFSGLKIYSGFSVLGYSKYRWTPNSKLKKHLFRPYVNFLTAIDDSLGLNTLKPFKKMTIRDLIRMMLYRDFIRN